MGWQAAADLWIKIQPFRPPAWKAFNPDPSPNPSEPISVYALMILFHFLGCGVLGRTLATQQRVDVKTQRVLLGSCLHDDK